MIRAKLSNGTFVLGVDAENVRRLTAGQPIVVDLSLTGGTDKVMIVYGETMQDILDDTRKASGGKLPVIQAMPSGTKQ